MAEPLAQTPRDLLGRPLGTLRISVTDRCNLRCQYCMPEDEYVWLPKRSLLTFEEIARLAGIFSSIGVRKVRITGGEPLLRHDLPTLIAQISATAGIEDIALTTNGVLLERHAAALRDAGLGRVTISLDTLRPDRFEAFARSARFQDVLRGIDASIAHGFTGTKINTVLMRSFNRDELTDLLAFGWERGAEVRFIEYMDVGGATQWDPREVVPRAEILDAVREAFGPVTVVPNSTDPNAPAERYRLMDGRMFGVIASTTAPFCRTCDRVRLTADGMMFLCLYADTGQDLRRRLREGASDGEIVAFITEVWGSRSDRGAEERLETPGRAALYQIAGLRSDPHREMHTRGG